MTVRTKYILLSISFVYTCFFVCLFLFFFFLICLFVFRIEMIPNQLFINLTDVVFVDFSNNSLGKAFNCFVMETLFCVVLFQVLSVCSNSLPHIALQTSLTQQTHTAAGQSSRACYWYCIGRKGEGRGAESIAVGLLFAVSVDPLSATGVPLHLTRFMVPFLQLSNLYACKAHDFTQFFRTCAAHASWFAGFGLILSIVLLSNQDVPPPAIWLGKVDLLSSQSEFWGDATCSLQ